MKRAVVSVLLGLAVQTAGAQGPSSMAASSVRGRIVDATTGVPLRRARIVTIAGEGRIDPVFTDDEGRFAIGGLRDEPVRLRAVKAGYAQVLVTVSVSQRDELVLPLTSSAAVTGRVVDAYGAFMIGATVSARLVAPAAGAAPNEFVQMIAETDLFGEYRIGALPPGRYDVAVVSTPMWSMSAGRAPLLSARLADDVLRGMRLNPRTAAATIDLGPGDAATMDFAVPVSAGACAPPAARPADPAATASLRGTVRGPSGEPLPCATVRLLARGIAVRPVTADEQGRFAVDNLPAATYRVEASNRGYVTFRYGQTAASDAGRVVALRDGQIRERVDVVLPRRSTISGTVLDDHGEPLEEITVAALQLRTVDGRTVAQRVAADRTDDRGRYRLGGLARGTYLVEASPEGALSLDDRADAAYAPVFHPAATDASTALPVSLDIGVDAAPVDLTLTRTAAATVSGVVFDRAGRPFNGLVMLAVSQRSGRIAPEPRQTTADVTGAFRFRGVSPGEYVIQAMRSVIQLDQRDEFGMQYVTVGDRDPAPVTIATSPGATIEGRLIVEGPDGDAVTAIGFAPLPADFDRAPMMGRRSELTRQTDGRFRITGVSGPRRFAMTGAPFGDNWYLKAARVNGADALDHPFDFGMVETVFRDVEVVASDAGATIAGRVDGDWSAIAADVEATVFSVYRDLWFEASRHVKRSRVAQDGTFSVSGLPPGEYFVALSEAADLRESARRDSQMLEALSSAAQRVTVAERERREIVLRVE